MHLLKNNNNNNNKENYRPYLYCNINRSGNLLKQVALSRSVGVKSHTRMGDPTSYERDLYTEIIVLSLANLEELMFSYIV
jgi:hypothetical protein